MDFERIQELADRIGEKFKPDKIIRFGSCADPEGLWDWVKEGSQGKNRISLSS